MAVDPSLCRMHSGARRFGGKGEVDGINGGYLERSVKYRTGLSSSEFIILFLKICIFLSREKFSIPTVATVMPGANGNASDRDDFLKELCSLQ